MKDISAVKRTDGLHLALFVVVLGPQSVIVVRRKLLKAIGSVLLRYITFHRQSPQVTQVDDGAPDWSARGIDDPALHGTLYVLRDGVSCRKIFNRSDKAKKSYRATPQKPANAF